MKKTLLTTLATIGLATGVFAQGTIQFQATSANGLVSYSTDNSTTQLYPTGTGVVGYGAGHVGFFTAPNGTVLTLGLDKLPDFTGWTANSTVLNIQTGTGKTSLTTINSSGNPGQTVEMEVVGWNGTATSWAQAIGNLTTTSLVGWSGRVFVGTGQASGALGWAQTTGDQTVTPAITPGATVTGAGGYSGLVLAPVPEPSTIALGGLGVAALLMFRRRK